MNFSMSNMAIISKIITKTEACCPSHSGAGFYLFSEMFHQSLQKTTLCYEFQIVLHIRIFNDMITMTATITQRGETGFCFVPTRWSGHKPRAPNPDRFHFTVDIVFTQILNPKLQLVDKNCSRCPQYSVLTRHYIQLRSTYK
jgi:hypothetical protein